ncbi:MAG: rhamnulokinase [Chloroflexi bacterium]|nr:rhamnulokinase [Chloroflexota bacterium]OJV97006.1 MAG: rhamnulokinase [Chloroflexi bacterium 54-19]
MEQITVLEVVAFDLGASSGRALLGRLDGDTLSFREIHRFPNDPVQVGNRLHWDILRLWHEIKQGLIKARQQSAGQLASLGIDSWAVDFGLLAENDELLGNPYHYRDNHTNGVMQKVWQEVSQAEIFKSTGIQFLTFNTVYQLYALKEADSPLLANARTLLLIPELLRFWLTGKKLSEWTNASTTQFMSATSPEWASTLLAKLDLPGEILAPLVPPGTLVGDILPEISRETGIAVLPVVAVGEHDTASAVAAVPAEETPFAYISCGTWSLIGTEIREPALSDKALEFNVTNERGVDNTFRLLKNVTGLWLTQECYRTWHKAGISISYEQEAGLIAETAAFRSFIDPDHTMFAAPGDMPEQIQKYCRQTGQPVPETPGEILRCIYQSLALKYRLVLEQIEELSMHQFKNLHMVGGGIQNRWLCQATADATCKTVLAGPTEASAIGNVIVQFLALGQFKTLAEARAAVRRSFPPEIYQPQDTGAWDIAYQTFRQIIDKRL